MTAGCGHLSALQARRNALPKAGRAAMRRLTLADQPQQAVTPASPATMAAPMSRATTTADWDLPGPDIGPTPSTTRNRLGWGQSFAMVSSKQSSKPTPRNVPLQPQHGAPDPISPAMSEPSAGLPPAQPPAPLPDPVPDEHKVFDSMGQSRSHVRTFDLGQIDMDAHLDRIERSLSMGQSASNDPPAPAPPEDVGPLDDFDLLSEVASISDDLLADIDMPDSPEDVSGMIVAGNDTASDTDGNGAHNAMLRTDPKPPNQNQGGSTAVMIDSQTDATKAEPSDAPPMLAQGGGTSAPEPTGGQPRLINSAHSDTKEGQDDDDDLLAFDFEAAPLQPLPYPQIGMMILADIHNLSFDTAAMEEGRKGWQAFDDLPRALTLAALKKAVGLRTATISAQEFADHATWPAVVVGDPKSREAILIAGRDETGLHVAAPDGSKHTASSGAVLAALDAPETLTIATIADSPVTAALSNLTGG